MRAAIRNGILGYTLCFNTDVPEPCFAPNQAKNQNKVLIEVQAAAINPVDYKIPRMLGGKIYGIDFCGTVKEVGESEDHDFGVGDTVFGFCGLDSVGGSLSDRVVVDVSKIAKTPIDWSSTECASIPTAYVTALQALRAGKIVDESELSQNDQKSVLVIGASGGCGIAGVQIAKALGVHRIVGICSKKNDKFVRETGCTEVVDYTNQDTIDAFFKENVGKFDCVYDTATNSGGGEDYWAKSIQLLKRNSDGSLCGEFVALNGPGSKWVRTFTDTQKPHETLVVTDQNGRDLEMVTSLLDRINTKPIMQSCEPFNEDNVKKGFDLLKSRRSRGKIVFDLTSEKK